MTKANTTNPGWLRLILSLAKVRITFAVTLTTLTGYVMAAEGFGGNFWLALLGTFLLAGGASALNQCQEAAIDARMTRTRKRPIPSGRVRPATALFIAGMLILLGLALLASVSVNTNAVVGLGLLALFWYNAVYTYLKRVTAFAVVPGAVIGAIPPLIGWAAAGGNATDPVILLVASFFFVWQIPHFWLLVLFHGDEYANAGLPVLTKIFTPGQLVRITSVWIVATGACGLSLLAFAPERVHLPWDVLLAVGSVWLALKAFGLVLSLRNADTPPPFKKAFMQINTYALLVMICLVLSALGTGWN